MIANSTGILSTSGQGVEGLFEQVFKSHFKSLHAYACTIMRDAMPAEEIVQNIFLKLWEKKEEITIKENVSVHLYRAVHNESLNYLRHRKVRSAYQSYAMRQHKQTEQEKPTQKIVMQKWRKNWRSPSGNYRSNGNVSVDMQCIDKNMYKYWYSMDQSSTGDGGTTAANPVTNVVGGALGYFSAHTSQTKTILVK